MCKLLDNMIMNRNVHEMRFITVLAVILVISTNGDNEAALPFNRDKTVN